MIYHILLLVTIVIWGTTFPITKLLINSGMTPTEILVFRFILAYLCLLSFTFKKLVADNLIDEFKFLLCGFFGGFLYFIAENNAIGLTQSQDVALLVCTAPLFTILLGNVFFKEPLKTPLIVGSVIAFIGVAFIIFGSGAGFEIEPLGDFLSLVAAASWAAYCLVLKGLSNRYEMFFITRKVFFYTLVLLAVYIGIFEHAPRFELLYNLTAAGCIAYLGFGASMACYLMWNTAVKGLGPEIATNYLYLQPLTAIIAANILLGEKMTILTGIGAVLILFGLYWAQRKHVTH